MYEFQIRVYNWVLECFGVNIAHDKRERTHRFLEEALELAQACGCTPREAYQLVDYVYSRPVGELKQEVGGVALTLAALCFAHDVALDVAAYDELKRVWGKMDIIRTKHAAKPKFGPLPCVLPIAVNSRVRLVAHPIPSRGTDSPMPPIGTLGTVLAVSSKNERLYTVSFDTWGDWWFAREHLSVVV